MCNTHANNLFSLVEKNSRVELEQQIVKIAVRICVAYLGVAIAGYAHLYVHFIEFRTHLTKFGSVSYVLEEGDQT